MRGRFISYLRVSTRKQGAEGLGIDAQRKAVNDYLNGGAWELVGEFVEVESGGRSERPQLVAALAACKKHKARLVIAKLDRLSRSVAFTATLMERGVDFVCCDNPHATPLTIHILAAMAEHERKQAGKRTSDAMAAAKAMPVWRHWPHAFHRAIAAPFPPMKAPATLRLWKSWRAPGTG